MGARQGRTRAAPQTPSTRTNERQWQGPGQLYSRVDASSRKSKLGAGLRALRLGSTREAVLVLICSICSDTVTLMVLRRASRNLRFFARHCRVLIPPVHVLACTTIDRLPFRKFHCACFPCTTQCGDSRSRLRAGAQHRESQREPCAPLSGALLRALVLNYLFALGTCNPAITLHHPRSVYRCHWHSGRFPRARPRVLRQASAAQVSHAWVHQWFPVADGPPSSDPGQWTPPGAGSRS